MAGGSAPAFKRCARSRTYDTLSNGSYTFQARSVSPAGSTDPTPASFHFHVQILYPSTTITSSPASTIGVSTAAFAFTSPSAGAAFAAACATATFTIDTRPPTVTAPASPTVPVGEQLGLDGTLGVDESWSASDTYSAASDMLYTVEQRAGAGLTSLGSFTATPALESMKGVTSANVPIPPSGLYHQLRVKAANQLGVSAEGPADRPQRLRRPRLRANAYRWSPRHGRSFDQMAAAALVTIGQYPTVRRESASSLRRSVWLRALVHPSRLGRRLLEREAVRVTRAFVCRRVAR